MLRRGFTLGAFFASIGATISKALGYDGQPQKPLSTIMPEGIGKFIDTTTGTDGQYSIKVGRKIMVLPRGGMGSGGWDVYTDTAETALRSRQEADVKDAIERQRRETFFALDMQPQVPREHLSVAPPGLKSWSEAPHALMPRPDEPTYATVDDLRQLRDDLGRAQRLPEDILRSTVFDLWRRLDQAINKRESFCNGHNGPALGLTAHHAMTDMGDGRRLCPYCYNKEIADGRAGGTAEGRPTS